MKTTGNSCILDTSVVIHAFRNNLLINSKLKTFESVFVSPTVVGELYYGAYSSVNPAKHITQIQSFLVDCIITTITSNAGIIYGRLKSGLRKNGTQIPENDIWIAAVSIDMKLPLFTTDKHFDYIEIELVSL